MAKYEVTLSYVDAEQWIENKNSRGHNTVKIFELTAETDREVIGKVFALVANEQSGETRFVSPETIENLTTGQQVPWRRGEHDFT